CWAWVDIHNTVSGARARAFIDKVVSVSGVNCRILGTKPHSGSVLCSRCQRWGHHHQQCRAKSTRCSLCGGPHRAGFFFFFFFLARPTALLNIPSGISPSVAANCINVHQCVNCTTSRPADRRRHAATDPKCPFWQHRFDRAWLRRQFKPRDGTTKPTSGK
ncbi:hypothetical protein AGABI2DRAFT_70540, partial [Agaricus bisporus var. bisporus H97]|uniref:hypothetical protein n=1 Tax=Agaricus bisporus var. bisporus (strain H97 / ATCC MYA-4626 / FGSC 10389) TaxID=936046 RepID=UPI00029F6736